ncbi:MAG: 50S ribosomal protein L3 [Actinobacteria bacterium RBG_19FT_COMBO_36_27]|nr:MAG: 50S ribosomal protein L3 [Actinobacteria bacterium RBG_19FT_COMBO_36_27]
MVNAIYGKKLGCTQIFNEKGNALYVTAIEAEQCVVIQVKDEKKDGYNALKIGFGRIKDRKATKPHKGEFTKNKVDLKRYLREIRVDEFDREYKPGDSLDLKIFKIGDKVKITGNNKGKGFAGVIKRHGFHRGKMSHGSHSHRIPGSVGMCSTPSRIAKGKKMPGRIGNKKVTISGSEIVDIIEEENLILIKGSVPGARGSLIFLRKI